MEIAPPPSWRRRTAAAGRAAARRRRRRRRAQHRVHARRTQPFARTASHRSKTKRPRLRLQRRPQKKPLVVLLLLGVTAPPPPEPSGAVGVDGFNPPSLPHILYQLVKAVCEIRRVLLTATSNSLYQSEYSSLIRSGSCLKYLPLASQALAAGSSLFETKEANLIRNQEQKKP